MLLAERVVSPQIIESPQMMESLITQFPPHTIELPQMIELPQVMLLPQVIERLLLSDAFPVVGSKLTTGDGAPPLTTSLLFSAE